MFSKLRVSALLFTNNTGSLFLACEICAQIQMCALNGKDIYGKTYSSLLLFLPKISATSLASGSQQVWLMTAGLPEITCTSQVRVAQFDITSLSSVDIRLFVTLYLFYLFLICVLMGCFCVWVDLER